MTTEEKIKIMQAYVDGKQIQATPKKCDRWAICVNEPTWDWYKYEYRIEPEYRPYKDTEELIADYKERFNVDVSPYENPMIWVKKNDFRDIYLINAYTPILVYMYSGWMSLKVLNEGFTYLDGSPVGKLVE